MDQAAQDKLIRYQRWEMARTWKDEGYHRLLSYRDAKTFREYIREAHKVFPSFIGPKVWVIYFLSYVSPSLCAALNRRKKQPKADPEFNIDVSELDFER